jgi:hypothetical protein
VARSHVGLAVKGVGALARALAAAGLAFVLAAAARAAPAQEPPGSEAIEMIDALLGNFASFRDVSAATLQREVTEVGGVPFRRDVPLDFMSKADLVKYLRELFDAEYPADKARADQRTLTALGLLAPGVDLRRVRAQLLEDNVVGFYDERPGRKRLYAVSEHRQLTPANQIILSHELRHALQDQYMDLHQALPASVGDFDDRRLALMSLVEGDATLVMEKFLAKRMGFDGSGFDLGALTMPPSMAMPEAPPVLRDQLILPYLLGRQFAAALFQKGGWPGVRGAWDRPPVSTEQVMHPEKYMAGEAARVVAVTWAPPGGRLLNEGVMGEMMARTLLGEGAEAAAAGWGGDAFKVWDLEGRTLGLWKSVWDTEADRREFLQALQAALGRRDAKPQARAGFTVHAEGAWRYAVGEREGAVVLISSDDLAALNAAITGR